MTTATVEKTLLRFEEASDWETRMRMLIDFGRGAGSIHPVDHVDANRVPGCSGKAWTTCRVDDDVVSVAVFSDSPVVHGMMSVVAEFYDGMTVEEARRAEPGRVVSRLGLGEFMSTQRVSGMRGFLARIRRDLAD